MPLRASQRKAMQRKRLRQQALYRVGLLLAIIVIACIIDLSFFSKGSSLEANDQIQLVIAKSVALGAMLNWLAQSVFSWFVFRSTGAKFRHNIVGQMYIGQIIKWIIVISGFSIIFMTVESFSAVAVMVGFIMMQIGHFFSLSKNY